MPETTGTTLAGTTGNQSPGTIGDRLAELRPAMRYAVIATAAGTGLLGLDGFANSFARVAAAAVPSFGGLAWTVPLGIDLGIAVFSALDIVLARLDMRVRWLRLIPWSLTAATIYLNVVGEFTRHNQAGHLLPVDWFAVVAHVVLPSLWVVAVEVGTHAVRVLVGLARATRMDRIRRSRWLLAPVPTLLLWRRMRLWEVRSYAKALDRERARVLALADLQEQYGRVAWRWSAPRRVRALYRIGELAPAGWTPAEPGLEPPAAGTTGTGTGPDLAETAAPRVARSRPQGTARPGTTRRTGTGAPVVPLGNRSESAALEWLRNQYRGEPVPGLNVACKALKGAGLGMRREYVRDRLLTQLAAERETTADPVRARGADR